MTRKKSAGRFDLNDLIQSDAENKGGDEICQNEKTDIHPDAERVKPKRKKSEPFCKTLKNILSLKATEGTVSQAIFLSPLGKDISYQEAIILAQVIKASNGDTQAASFIRDFSEGKQKYDGKEKHIKFEDL